MNKNIKLRLLGLVAAGMLLCAAGAKADTFYDFTFSGSLTDPQSNQNVSASGVLETDAAGNVTGIVGTFTDTSAMTGLPNWTSSMQLFSASNSADFNPDNLVISGPALDGSGLGFSANGIQWDVYQGGAGYMLANSVAEADGNPIALTDFALT